MITERDRIWFEIESGALKILFSRDRRENAPTPKQLMTMNSLVNGGLAQTKLRHAVLSKITGLVGLSSTYQLTAGMASILIDYLKLPDEWGLTPTGARLLRVAEDIVLEDDYGQQEPVLQAHASQVPDP